MNDEFTDTELLDYWLEHSNYQPLNFRSDWGFASGNVILGRGDSQRACIADAKRNNENKNKAV